LLSPLLGAAGKILPIFGGSEPASFVVRMHSTVGPLPAFFGLALIFVAFH
jgi:hypothetical protein